MLKFILKTIFLILCAVLPLVVYCRGAELISDPDSTRPASAMVEVWVGDGMLIPEESVVQNCTYIGNLPFQPDGSFKYPIDLLPDGVYYLYLRASDAGQQTPFAHFTILKSTDRSKIPHITTYIYANVVKFKK